MAKAALDELDRRRSPTPVHGGHPGRRHRPVARPRPLVLGPLARRAGHLLGPGRRRHRGRQQGVDQDHRGAHGPVGPGLLRLRLPQVGRGDHLPPAVRTRPHPLHLPDRRRRLRGVPPVVVPRPPGRPARRGPTRGHLPAQQPVPAGGGVGSPPVGDPGGDHRQGPRSLGHRRQPRRPGHGDGQPDQHRDAAVLLRAERRAAARGGHRRHQGERPRRLRQARPRDRGAEPRRHRRRPRRPAAGRGAVHRVEPVPPTARGGGRGPRLRAADHRQDARR